jgi:hypothetical protein
MTHLAIIQPHHATEQQQHNNNNKNTHTTTTKQQHIAHCTRHPHGIRASPHHIRTTLGHLAPPAPSVHLLSYAATHPNASILYQASDLCLHIHSNASYLSYVKTIPVQAEFSFSALNHPLQL